MGSDNQIINWETIKKKIIDNVCDDYKPNNRLNDLVELFIKLITLPSAEQNLNGIPMLFPTALNKALVEHTDIEVYIPEIAHVEKLLRKLLSLVDYNQYVVIRDNKDGLAAIISSLGLNPNQINYTWTTLNDHQKRNNAEHLLRVYQFRNISSHECKTYGEVKLFTILQSALIIYLYAIDLHYSKLRQILITPSKYINTIKEDFKKWQNRFVAINGKEVPQEIALYAIETPLKKSSKENVVREGEVAQLRDQLKQTGDYQMIITGEAGIGKTTTMQYLTYKDCLSGSTPIYVELKLITANDSILSVIKRKLGNASVDYQSIMRSPKTCVFLDGLNEVLPSIKDSIYREILGLINSFPRTFFVLSTRAQNYNGELGQIPVFALQKMDSNKINEFLLKNCDSKEVRSIIQEAISNNSNWLLILGTPLILYMLIQIVAMGGELPNDENKIILQFIRNLYSREKGKDFFFNTEIFHSIICNIAFESIDKVGDTNTGFTFASIRNLLKNSAFADDKLLLDTLQKGVELNLLVKDGNLYSFSHQTYQETLAGDFINTLFA